jgi:hypothetical protein
MRKDLWEILNENGYTLGQTPSGSDSHTPRKMKK